MNMFEQVYPCEQTDRQTDRQEDRQTLLITKLDDWSVTEKDIFKSKLTNMIRLKIRLPYSFPFDYLFILFILFSS